MARPRVKKILLSDDQVRELKKVLKSAKVCDTVKCRCRVLLDLDMNHGTQYTYEQCANRHGMSKTTVRSVIDTFSSGGLNAVLTIRRSVNSDNANRKVDGRAESRIIQLACGPAPEGHGRWTLRLLADKSKVVLDEPVGKDAIARVLKKKEIRPHRNQYWCIPSKEDPEFIACMEDVLDVYERPYDPLRPVICMDEKPYHLLGEGREPLPMKPGSDKKLDSEYVRNGTCSIFAMIEQLGGWHRVSVREHRTAVDWAEEIKEIVDSRPEVEKIVLVMDNLNTHKPASLYKRFPPEEARRIYRKLEIHYTPKHGSWLDIAEIELNMMTRQCLDRRIDNIETLKRELDAWECEKNNEEKKVIWQFRTKDARIKLASLYPKLG